MAADELSGLNDLPLPDLDELQIPSEFDLSAFDEAGLLGDPLSLIVYDAATEPLHNHSCWSAPAVSDGDRPSADAVPRRTGRQQPIPPGASKTAATAKGTVERRAEQNRCCKVLVQAACYIGLTSSL